MATAPGASKHEIAETQDVFVPPSLNLPIRPPFLGFPSEMEVVVPEVCNGYKAKMGHICNRDMLLNASPTLELSGEEAEAILSSLRQHPKFAHVSEQLRDIDDSYLDKLFDNEDAKDEDTRRRVDRSAALATLKSNAPKRLSMCVSCLTRGQHRHYRPWVISYLTSGEVPKATEDYPDMSTVIELVRREQSSYLHKLMVEITSCEACKVETGFNKRESAGSGPTASHRACWNHNYIDESVERFAKRWWLYRLESQLQNRTFTEEESHSDDCENFSDVVWDIRRSLASTADVGPAVTLHARTHQLSVQHTESTTASRKSRGLSVVLPTVVIPPTLPLDVQQLENRKPQLYLHEGPESNYPGTLAHDCAPVLKDVIPPTLPFSNVTGVSFTLRVCKSSLLKLATAHLSSCRANFRLPVHSAWNPSEQRFDIVVGKPLPPEQESRRNINAMAMKRLVDAEQRLPTNARCTDGTGHCYASVAFGDNFAFLLTSKCKYDLAEGHPVFRMVKMEYNCKGYNTIPDDEKTFQYENFSKKEVICMWTILRCNPTATLYVYRINAYSSAVIGIEQYSYSSFSSQVLGGMAKDKEINASWRCLRDALENSVTAVVRRHQRLLEKISANCDALVARSATFVLLKATQASDIMLCSVDSCYPERQELAAAVDSFIEPSSRLVCRREYIPPCVWPYSDRIPFTYGPTPKCSEVINRTTETRHDSEYYAKHDIWRHEVQYYTVGGDGIVRERVSSDGNRDAVSTSRNAQC
uniref:Uncharacterized protein n=1 Tax=Trypanosoma vivax (strain Y486) TaxID=1055687 RepID=G0U3L8_TRYVY|nr:conserved hypothetical protein [Trypanosoma vivax Y486]